MELRTTFALAQSERTHAVMRAAASRRKAHPSSPAGGAERASLEGASHTKFAAPFSEEYTVSARIGLDQVPTGK